MLSEALDITIESRGNSIWLILSGPFNQEQITNIRTKIEGFIRDGHRLITINLESITHIHKDVAPMLLNMLNLIRGKGGNIKLIFKNETVTTAFLPYRNIFTIFPDERGYSSQSILRSFFYWFNFQSKKTGIRVSTPVAIFILAILTGLFFSIGIIINLQKIQLAEQEYAIQQHQLWKRKAEIEITTLKNRIKPMEQLGLLIDSLSQ